MILAGAIPDSLLLALAADPRPRQFQRRADYVFEIESVSEGRCYRAVRMSTEKVRDSTMA